MNEETDGMCSAQPPRIQPGVEVGHYRVTRLLGAGGMGEVYLAEDILLGRPAALKFISPAHEADPDFRAQLLNEAQATAALNHPNIVTVYDVGEHNGRLYIAMEYVDGQALSEFSKLKSLSLDRIIELILQVCAGLAKAHEAGIVHRDIKPHNIIVDREGRARILDFGLASLRRATGSVTGDATMGTPAYISPEQVGGTEVDKRTDIFSLGVVLYELVGGCLPFTGDYEAAVLYAVTYQQPRPLGSLRPDLPPLLVKVVERALQKNPADRYQSVAELATELGQMLSPPATANRAPALPSIAVLRFSDRSPQKDLDYFCDGMADEIITALTKVGGLRVAARTSTLQFQGADLDIRRIGRLLQVDTVLEGSVRSAGQRLRITTQLVNVADGFYLWSEKYDREMADVFAVQDEIARAIAAKLEVRLGGGRDAPLVKPATQDLEAYNLYLRGRYFWNRRYEGGLQRGVQYFQQAIARDPQYAPAYAGLADSFNILAFYNFVPPHLACPQAKAAAVKSLELDDESAEAHTALGWALTFYDWNWPAAEREFRRAMELNPEYATTHHYYGLFLLAMGRFEEGLAQMRTACDLDPLLMITNTSAGAGLYFARRHEESVRQHQKALDLDPDFPLAHAFLAGPYVALGRYSEALEECRRAGALSGGSKYATAFLAYVYGVSGESERANELLERMLDLSRSEYVSSYHIALIHAGLGNREAACDWLEKALEERDNWMVWLKIYPVFDSLRHEPRFREILKKVGF